MKYAIDTIDGYAFLVEATEDSCRDLVNNPNDYNGGDCWWANESELLAWVAENIESIGRFERSGFDSVIGI